MNDSHTGMIAKTSALAVLDSVVAGSWSLERNAIDQYFIGKHACEACQLPAVRRRFRQVGPAPSYLYLLVCHVATLAMPSGFNDLFQSDPHIQ